MEDLEIINVDITGYGFSKEGLRLFTGIVLDNNHFFPGPDIFIGKNEKVLLRFINEDRIDIHPNERKMIFVGPWHQNFYVNFPLSIYFKDERELENFIVNLTKYNYCSRPIGNGSWKCKSFSESTKSFNIVN